MIIEQLEYSFFFINLDILLLKVLYSPTLRTPARCAWECTKQEDQINSNES